MVNAFGLKAEKDHPMLSRSVYGTPNECLQTWVLYKSQYINDSWAEIDTYLACRWNVDAFVPNAIYGFSPMYATTVTATPFELRDDDWTALMRRC